MLESNQRLAVIDRGLDLRANPAWCAVRELNPHLLGVGQLFWSVELPARQIGRGYRCRTCLAALIWRRSGYKPLLLPEAPPLVARDGFEPAHGVSNSHVPFQLGYRPKSRRPRFLVGAFENV